MYRAKEKEQYPLNYQEVVCELVENSVSKED
jgi:hypothetical protein